MDIYFISVYFHLFYYYFMILRMNLLKQVLRIILLHEFKPQKKLPISLKLRVQNVFLIEQFANGSKYFVPVKLT